MYFLHLALYCKLLWTSCSMFSQPALHRPGRYIAAKDAVHTADRISPFCKMCNPVQLDLPNHDQRHPFMTKICPIVLSCKLLTVALYSFSPTNVPDKPFTGWEIPSCQSESHDQFAVKRELRSVSERADFSGLSFNLWYDVTSHYMIAWSVNVFQCFCVSRTPRSGGFLCGSWAAEWFVLSPEFPRCSQNGVMWGIVWGLDKVYLDDKRSI